MSATNDFEKDFFKLIINTAYGKTMKNLQKRISVRLMTTEKEFFLIYTSRPTPITHKMFNKDFAAVHEIKPVLMLNRPIYVGFTVLELSKWLMYDFHYNFIKNNFDAELLFTNTDRLAYKTKSEDVYEKILSTNICLTLVIIQKIQSFLMRLIKKLLAK